MALWTQWIWFALLGLMWLLVAGNNIFHLIDARRRGGATSLTLFIGGFFGAAAAMACPINNAWVWFWVPALLDPGSIPAIFRILRARNNAPPSGDNPDSL
jgi:hypothetical protein